MHFSIVEVLFLLTLIPEILALTAGVINYKRLGRSSHYLLLLVSVGLITGTIMRILSQQKINNHFVITLYIPTEFWLLCCVYQQHLKSRLTKKAMPWFAGGLAVFSLITGITRTELSLNPIERFLEGGMVLSIVLLYFHETLKYLTARRLEATSLFWLSTGLFLYFACDILIFIFSNLILHSYSMQFNFQLWGLHAVLTAVLYIFYLIALCLDRKN